MSSGGGDPHRVLGVPHDASEAEIRGAYRALAKRHHPDAGQGSVARFLEIQAAYETLVGGDRPGAPRARPGAPSRPGATDPATKAARTGLALPDLRRRAGAIGGRGAGRVPDGGRRANGRRRATLGSTSYDEAEEVFEPDWGGRPGTAPRPAPTGR